MIRYYIFSIAIIAFPTPLEKAKDFPHNMRHSLSNKRKITHKRVKH